mmetsp:Transcript_4773/g.15190  ORF Transcript_4773/g.15190 Transcript_4773/m.15190 type:complete len:162 (+) Transcript_4773:121-606(+)
MLTRAMLRRIPAGAPPTWRFVSAEAAASEAFRAPPAAVARRSLRLLDPTYPLDTISEAVKKIFTLENAPKRVRAKAREQDVGELFKLHEVDCGSTRFQIARLCVRIDNLADHCTTHRKDKHTKRGLVMMMNKRIRLLKYLKREDPEDYITMIKTMGLKPVK